MLEVLTSWLEDGSKVVDPLLAQKRGEICAKCPMNITANWWEKISKEPAAELVKQYIQIKNNSRLGVAIEEDLGLCEQ